MKKKSIILLVVGLLLVSVMPLIARYYAIPDFMRGFLTGIGLMLEFLALIIARREKSCMKLN